MDCVESDPCHGVLIDNYRFVLLQHALMDKKMNVCPKHQFLKLKEKVSNGACSLFSWNGVLLPWVPG